MSDSLYSLHICAVPRNQTMRVHREKEVLCVDHTDLFTVIQLARLYGIAETLHPLRRRKNEGIASLILQWAERYARSGADDLSAFFGQVIRDEYDE